MPTDNPKISGYIPQLLFDRLKEFQNERGLSMSQAIAVVLSEYFGLEGFIKSSQSSVEVGGVSLERFQNLEGLVRELKEKVDCLEFTGGLPALTKGELDIVPESSLPLFPETDFTSSLKPISGHVLSSVRFQLNRNTVAKNKSKWSAEKFTKWTTGKDPDGIAWQYIDTPSKGYIPTGELSSEQTSSLLSWLSSQGLI